MAIVEEVCGGLTESSICPGSQENDFVLVGSLEFLFCNAVI